MSIVTPPKPGSDPDNRKRLSSEYRDREGNLSNEIYIPQKYFWKLAGIVFLPAVGVIAALVGYLWRMDNRMLLLEVNQSHMVKILATQESQSIKTTEFMLAIDKRLDRIEGKVVDKVAE